MKSPRRTLTKNKIVSRDIVHELLDWQRVVGFFKEFGPGVLTIEIKKDHRSIYIKQKFV